MLAGDLAGLTFTKTLAPSAPFSFREKGSHHAEEKPEISRRRINNCFDHVRGGLLEAVTSVKASQTARHCWC
jgi:hypothetical protein